MLYQSSKITSVSAASKLPGFDDRKLASINAIQANLRSSNRGAFTQLEMQLIFRGLVLRVLFGFFLILLSPLQGSARFKVDVSAKGAVLMNAETGAILWEKNAHTPLYPSSTTKLITALYALEKKGNAFEALVTASYDAVAAVHPSVRRSPQGKHPPYRLEFGGTHIGLKAGEILPLRALMYGLMLNSGNDAANWIAEYVSGSVPAFMEELNRFVGKKGVCILFCIPLMVFRILNIRRPPMIWEYWPARR